MKANRTIHMVSGNLPDEIRKIAGLLRAAQKDFPDREFTGKYSALIDQMFLGNWSAFWEGLRQADSEAIKFALVFIEVRPYYFRSQYQRTYLIRALKRVRAKLNPEQTRRLEAILAIEHEKKMQNPRMSFKQLLQQLSRQARSGR